MSYDTMAAHDEGIAEAKRVVREALGKHYAVECNCVTCGEWKRAQRRILAALTKLEQNR